MPDGMHQLAVGQLQRAAHLGAQLGELAVDQASALGVGGLLIGADAQRDSGRVAEGRSIRRRRVARAHVAHAFPRRQARVWRLWMCHLRRIVLRGSYGIGETSDPGTEWRLRTRTARSGMG